MQMNSDTPDMFGKPPGLLVELLSPRGVMGSHDHGRDHLPLRP
jgi:hypothetical protein